MLIFQYRSTQLDAWHGRRGVLNTFLQPAIATPAPQILDVTTEVGVFGGKYLDIAHAAGPGRGIAYFGRLNWSENPAISVLLRVIPRFSGASGAYHYILNAVDPDGAVSRNGLEFYLTPTNQVGIYMTDAAGNLVLSFASSPITTVAGTAMDIMFSWDGSNTAGSVKVSVNGVEIAAANPIRAMVPDPNYVRSILLGYLSGGPICNFDINEAVVWNSAEPHVYSPRSDFTPATQFNGQYNQDPGIANVRLATHYFIDGVELIGSLNLPAQADVRFGVTYDGASKTGLIDLPAVARVKGGTVFDNGTKTGTLVSTDAGQGNVRRGVPYMVESVSKVGAMFAPSANTLRLLDNQPVPITIGEDVEFLVRLRAKDGKSPLDASSYSAIMAKFLKNDGTSIQLTLAGGAVFVNQDDPLEIIVVMSAATSALLKEADDSKGQDLGPMEVITIDAAGEKSIYDYPGSLRIQKAALP